MCTFLIKYISMVMSSPHVDFRGLQPWLRLLTHLKIGIFTLLNVLQVEDMITKFYASYYNNYFHIHQMVMHLSTTINQH